MEFLISHDAPTKFVLDKLGVKECSPVIDIHLSSYTGDYIDVKVCGEWSSGTFTTTEISFVENIRDYPRFSKNVRTITKKLTQELLFTILNTKVDENLLVSQAIMFDILTSIEN
jgi:hypothetical protein